MGVVGLMAYLCSRAGGSSMASMRQQLTPSCRLVLIDGPSLLFACLRRAVTVSWWIAALRAVGADPLVFWDGPVPPRKRSTRLARRQAQLASSHAALDVLAKVRPPSLLSVP